jgi:hypothetical protein
MAMDLDALFDIVLSEFPIDVSSTKPLEFNDVNKGLEVYEVDAGNSPLALSGASYGSVYIIDSISGREIACHPSIVGETLEGLCLGCSSEFSSALVRLGLFHAEGTAVLHILRGAAGYRVVDALPVRVPVVSVRTEYRGDGYRAHSDDSRGLTVTYRDYPVDLDLSEVYDLIIPDTYATGRSAEAALLELFEARLEPKRIILYGFIAIPALNRVGTICEEKGIEMHSFAICDVTQLADNHYDMPLYGLDESLHKSTGEVRRLGSIVAKDTLASMLPRYVAGMDQPGDWSERQVSLFTGRGNESGDIVGHLEKSLGLIESLRELNSEQPWYGEGHEAIALAEKQRLTEALLRYKGPLV